MAIPIKPSSIAILTTYHCTAKCEQCCFQCGPELKVKLSRKQMFDFIESSVENFSPNLKLCAFTGGECFTLGHDLVEAVGLAHSLGLATRCVSNGYWATSKDAAYLRLKELKDAGLDELNFSTGDNHQKWVPFQNIVNGSLMAISLGIRTIISVEGYAESKFKYSNAVRNKEFQNYWETCGSKNDLSIINAVWIPMKTDGKVSQDSTQVIKLDEMNTVKPCETILSFLGLNPFNKLVGCCGITMEYINEMKLGDSNKESILTQFNRQFDDFMKIWLWVDGPERILYFAYQHDHDLKPVLENITHPCQACVELYKSRKVKKVLLENYDEIVESVLFRYELKRQKYNQALVSQNAEVI